MHTWRYIGVVPETQYDPWSCFTINKLLAKLVVLHNLNTCQEQNSTAAWSCFTISTAARFTPPRFSKQKKFFWSRGFVHSYPWSPVP